MRCMPNLKQVIDVLETLYPLRYAEQWDEPGLIVGDLTRDIGVIAFAADPTSAIVDEAIEAGADLLVTHHPLFFRAVHETGGLGFRGDIVRRLYQHGCALWVGHTNADAAWRGVGQAAADAFGLTNQQPLVPISDPQSDHPVGLGRVGRLAEPITLNDFARRVFDAVDGHGMATALGVQVCGDPDAMVRTVAVLPGSGDSLFDEVRATGADVYVTSDLRHHPVTDAIEQARYEARMRAAGIALGKGDECTRPYFINTPHAAIESIWFNYAVEDVPQAVERATGGRPRVTWLHRATDPWTWTITSSGTSHHGVRA
ncbi:Nif3-like dinuclear metal center hexameric protein [Bifidobacterium myosotis]|uniref:GTP cyclohydrolase 1 type 2 homolog n=2 Tax=Bifidobacterium myosotis TaxID=1630166 RepID=A0A5M9ZGD8_9BIFI|nr:Nif3-like dinuclear metal center hexameric protein [Bifidobacterium myosotis]